MTYNMGMKAILILEEVAEDFHFPFIPQDLFYRYKLK
jgi:hypothetical protein